MEYLLSHTSFVHVDTVETHLLCSRLKGIHVLSKRLLSNTATVVGRLWEGNQKYLTCLVRFRYAAHVCVGVSFKPTALFWTNDVLSRLDFVSVAVVREQELRLSAASQPAGLRAKSLEEAWGGWTVGVCHC